MFFFVIDHFFFVDQQLLRYSPYLSSNMIKYSYRVNKAQV